MNEHERAHEDVPMVAEPTVLVSLGTEADGRLVEFHPARANFWWRFAWKGKNHGQHGDHKEIEQHNRRVTWKKKNRRNLNTKIRRVNRETCGVIYFKSWKQKPTICRWTVVWTLQLLFQFCVWVPKWPSCSYFAVASDLKKFWNREDNN